MAEAIGMALSSSKMTLFGSPEMASTMLQSMAKGMGVRTMLEGFTGNGAAPANPLTSVAELIAPLVERFSGKPIDAATIESVVTATLEAQRARSAPVVQPPPAETQPAAARSAVLPADPAPVSAPRVSPPAATERRK